MIHPILDAPSPEKKTESQQPHPQETNISIPKNLTRAPKSTSLKDLLDKEPEVSSQPVSAKPSKLSTPFGPDDLIRCWEAHSETLIDKAHLKNTMIHCTPVLLADFKFEVTVFNPAQQEELISNSIEILKTLRTQLQNDQIQMHIHVDTSNEKKPIYTSTEKFEFLHNLNPLLSKLKDEFDLTID